MTYERYLKGLELIDIVLSRLIDHEASNFYESIAYSLCNFKIFVRNYKAPFRFYMEDDGRILISDIIDPTLSGGLEHLYLDFKGINYE